MQDIEIMRQELDALGIRHTHLEASSWSGKECFVFFVINTPDPTSITRPLQQAGHYAKVDDGRGWGNYCIMVMTLADSVIYLRRKNEQALDKAIVKVIDLCQQLGLDPVQVISKRKELP